MTLKRMEHVRIVVEGSRRRDRVPTELVDEPRDVPNAVR